MRATIVLLAAAAVAAPTTPAFAQQTVPVAPFRSMELCGGGSVIVRSAPVQRVTLLEGSTAYTRFDVTPSGKLLIDACRERCPRNYRVRILVEGPAPPSLAIFGGGSIRTESGFGRQPNFSIAVRGGGTIDARSVATLNGSAAIQGGQILTTVHQHLVGGVNGGGAIRYWGNPYVTQAVRGGGAISQGR